MHSPHLFAQRLLLQSCEKTHPKSTCPTTKGDGKHCRSDNALHHHLSADSWGPLKRCCICDPTALLAKEEKTACLVPTSLITFHVCLLTEASAAICISSPTVLVPEKENKAVSCNSVNLSLFLLRPSSSGFIFVQFSCLLDSKSFCCDAASVLRLPSLPRKRKSLIRYLHLAHFRCLLTHIGFCFDAGSAT